MACCTWMLWIGCFPWMLWPMYALLFLLSALVLRVFCLPPQDCILRPSLLEKHAADFTNNIKVNNLSQSLSNSPAGSFLHMDSSSQICLSWWCSCRWHSFAIFFSTISYCLSILLGRRVHCSVTNIFIQTVSSVCHLLSDDHLSSVLKWGLQSKVEAKQLFMLATKPSPAASQHFRTGSPKFSTQISGDCTPALGYCFWWLISWDWHNYLLGTSRFVDGLLNVSKGIKRRELRDWSGSVVETTYALSGLHGRSYIRRESHQRDLQITVLFLGVA